MSNNYKSKLRSYKANKETQVETKQEEEVKPQTPAPIDDIQAFFPPSPFGRKRTQTVGDRFIPTRERDIARDFQLAHHTKRNSSDGTELCQSQSNRRMHAYFRAELLDDPSAINDFIAPETNTRRIMHYTVQEPNSPSSSSSSLNRVIAPVAPPATVNVNLPLHNLLNSPSTPNASRFQTSTISEAGRRILSISNQSERPINTNAIKTLDAPDLKDDFYLNLIDWGANDRLAVGLGHSVYLWNASTSQVTKLRTFADKVTSVNWSKVGSLLAIGTGTGRCYLFDTEAVHCMRTWHNHASRIGTIAWRSNIISTGGRDGKIYHHDVRSPNAYFRKLSGHQHEVCGLKWNPEGTMLASGGNDNKLLIWNSHQNVQSHRFSQHQAAIKAISWSPHKRGLLASGGGTADMTIKLWNAASGQLNSSHYVGSQVCNLLWSEKTDEIVSTHGYSKDGAASSNSVIVWKADKMQKLASLSGHTSRVLYLSLSSDGNTVATGAGDETIKFWDLFSLVKKTKPFELERKGCLR